MTHTTAEEAADEEEAAVATAIFSKLQRGNQLHFRISKSRLIAKGKWRRIEVIRCCTHCAKSVSDNVQRQRGR